MQILIRLPLQDILQEQSGPRQANLVLMAYASSLARTSAARSYKQWAKRNLQTESQIPGPLNGWACAVKICHDGMLEDINSLDWAQSDLGLHCLSKTKDHYSNLLINEPSHDQTNKITCTLSEDSDQPGHPLCLISLCCQHGETLCPKLPIECTAKTQIRLGGCPGWSESSLSAHLILLVLLCCGSNASDNAFSGIICVYSLDVKMVLSHDVASESVITLFNKSYNPLVD